MTHSKLQNDSFIRAIKKLPVARTPIWLMRQAGRYLPEYRQVREQAKSFINLCKNPELACEVTMQPLARFNLDAAIIFSDILTIPDAMGLGLQIVEAVGPQFTKPLHNEHDINQLQIPDLEQLNYVYEAIRLVKHELNGKIPLIGFCGSPWTLAVYMLEGKANPGFPKAQSFIHQHPLLLHHLLDVLAESVAMHLNAQVQAGADAVMIFDTWGGMLGDEDYAEFSLYYIKAIITILRTTYNIQIPVILFTRGGNRWIEKMAETGCDMLGLDWEISLQDARKRVGDVVALQGNMDPAILLQAPQTITDNVDNILASYGKGSGHVFNLGHGITPNVNPEHVAVLIEAVHNLSQPYHKV